MIAIPASIRYNIPVLNFRFRTGLVPGTFLCAINYQGEHGIESSETNRETSSGLNFQTEIDILKKDKEGNDILSFTIFSDFFSPEIEGNMINLFEPGWI